MTTPPAGWVIPDGYEFANAGNCRGCMARIAWCRTKAGKRAPLNPDGTSHFANCPAAASFRERQA